MLLSHPVRTLSGFKNCSTSQVSHLVSQPCKFDTYMPQRGCSMVKKSVFEIQASQTPCYDRVTGLLFLVVCTPRSPGRLFTITWGHWYRGSTGSIGPVGPPAVLVAGLACILGFQECHYSFNFIGCFL